jgi:Glu-tRNA(Gln) amidotransferase subunit E-like FAD-binding protein
MHLRILIYKPIIIDLPALSGFQRTNVVKNGGGIFGGTEPVPKSSPEQQPTTS